MIALKTMPMRIADSAHTRHMIGDEMRRPKAPPGLDTAGRSLWRDPWRTLIDAYEFSPVEVAVLTAACRQADDVARLESVIASDGVIVEGSAGQPRLSAVVTEVRQGRLALARLLSDLAIPADDDDTRSGSASVGASRAARVRWDRLRGDRSMPRQHVHAGATRRGESGAWPATRGPTNRFRA